MELCHHHTTIRPRKLQQQQQTLQPKHSLFFLFLEEHLEIEQYSCLKLYQ